jgi:RNA polymerase sigma-70 factor (ECF subfamily)
MPEKEQFLEYFLPRQLELRAFISAIVRDRDARDDVFQDVSQTLWQQFDRFDRSRSFSAWARGIARNKILHRWRRDKKNPVPLSPEAIEAVCEAYEETEPDSKLMSESLRHCMEGLPENSRRLLEWRYEASLRLGEIADRLQTSLGAVNKALFRLRVSLQSCIERKMNTLETE